MPLLAPTIRPTGVSRGPTRTTRIVHRWNDECLQPMPHSTASVAIADGQQPRVGAISCASAGPGLSIPAGRNSSRASVSRAGERGLSHRKGEFIETPLSKTIAKLRPQVANRAAPVFDLHERECTMLRYTNPLIESQRLMYSSRSLRTWSAVYGPSLELNDCQPVCR